MPFSERLFDIDSAVDPYLKLIAVPWDVTASYRKGTSDGPSAISKASVQIDAFDDEFNLDGGVGFDGIEFYNRIQKLNSDLLPVYEKYCVSKNLDLLNKINSASQRLHVDLESLCLKFLNEGKKIGLVGGEHSVSFGAIKAASQKYDDFGILHIDAHMDLRKSYQGIKHSHASIMRNVIEEIDVQSLTSVGVRDYCKEEFEFAQGHPKINVFSDNRIRESLFKSHSYQEIVDEILSTLPKNVWISFDIDGLDPSLCPGTGTPVPGGLGFNEANHLLRSILRSNRKVLGFDLVEVTPEPSSEWNENVGMRILHLLCLLTLSSER